ncbi:MAG: DUF6111 family protein [Pseudomonadota bacterium]
MIRVIITQIVLFLLPFVAFFVYRLTTQGWTGAKVSSWGRATFYLIVAGGVLVAAGFIFLALTGNDSGGVYVPIQFEDGQLIPGAFRPRED